MITTEWVIADKLEEDKKMGGMGGADDAAGRENLARYLIRVPISKNKIRYDTVAQTLISWPINFAACRFATSTSCFPIRF